MGRDEGICEAAIAEETDERVYVRVILCYDEREQSSKVDYVDCPTHVYLEQPLGDRVVVDAFTGLEVPLLAPKSGERPSRSWRPSGPAGIGRSRCRAGAADAGGGHSSRRSARPA